MMSGWGEFAAAFAAFMGAHAIPTQPRLRARLSAALGEGGFVLAYAAVSLGLLAWLIGAAGRAPYAPLWEFAPWQLLAPKLAMVPACLLLAFGAGAVNPLSFGGRAPASFDPEAPGIAGITRHPLLWALAIWAGAHLIPNGDLAHAALFGIFALFALSGMRAIDRRLRRRMGEGEWRRLARNAPLLPFGAGFARLTGFRGAVWRALAAAGLYLALTLAHGAVIGVDIR